MMKTGRQNQMPLPFGKFDSTHAIKFVLFIFFYKIAIV